MAVDNRYLLRGARLAGGRDEYKVDLLVDGERIGAIGDAGSLSAPRVEDIDGLWVLPGVIDAHVHPIHNETFASIGSASPYGGTTTVLYHLYPDAGESVAQAVGRATSAARQAPADFGFHVRLTPDRITEHLAQLPHPGVVSAKVFLAHPDPTVMCSLGDFYTASLQAAARRVTLVVHAEVGDVVNRVQVELGPAHDLTDFDAQRPGALEAAAIHAVGAIGLMTDADVYIAHLSSAAALAAALLTKAAGAQLSLEACVHHLFLTKDLPLGSLGKVAPPLRSAGDVAALRMAVRNADIDVVASDHCGYDERKKLGVDFAGSANGLPGLEILLPLLLDAAIGGEWLTMEDLVRVLCSGPARVFGLEGKGELTPGSDADIVLIDPISSYVVRHDDFHDRTFYTPYEGQRLRGQIVRVIRRGETLVEDRAVRPVTGGRPVRIRH